MEKIYRGNASQFFVAGELCRRGLCAVVTLGNTPNVDVLCSNSAGTRFAHVQVKTFVPGRPTCSVGLKAEKNFGKSFFWVLAGIPLPKGKKQAFEYYIIPADVMAKNVADSHAKWLSAPGVRGRPHRDSAVRTVHLPPRLSFGCGWTIASFRDRWDLIEACLSE